MRTPSLNTFALSLAVAATAIAPLAGCDRLFGLQRVDVQPTPPPPRADNGYSCVCTCSSSGGGTPTTMNLRVCNPAGYDPNQGGLVPDAQKLMADCGSDRVIVQVQKMMDQCYMRKPTCTCATASPLPDTFYDASCSNACSPSQLVNCANWDPKGGTKTANCADATTCQNPGPVCLAQQVDPPLPTPAALVAGMMGRATTCTVDAPSQVAITANGETRTSPLIGQVDFSPAPASACSGAQPCLSLHYRLDATSSFSWSGFLDLDSVTLSELETLGATTAFSLDANGAGSIGGSALQSSGRLRQVESSLLGDDVSGEKGFGPNDDALPVTFDGSTFSLSGNVLGSVGDSSSSSSARVQASVSGHVVNTPPHGSLGGDRNVECTSPSGASVVLDAGASTDAENNIVYYGWFKGTRSGADLGSGVKITVAQPLGAQTYFVKPIDAYGQADEASATITVVDTTAPAIACNAPATITPASTPISFTASASDVCSSSVSAAVTGYRCYKVSKTHEVSKLSSCVVKLSGGTITIVDSGGVDDYIEWTVRSTDGSGNAGAQTCVVHVIQG